MSLARRRRRAVRPFLNFAFELLEDRALMAADGPPVATIVGTSDGYQGVRGQTRTLLFQATDPSPSDQAGTFNYTINWGDGAVQSVSGPSSISVDHTYFLESPYRVTVQARDQQGVTGPVSNATTLNIGIFEQQGPSVALAGSSGYDTFIVNQTANRTFSLSYNYAPYGTVTIGTGGEIRLFGQGNWDQVTLNGTTGNDTFDVTTSGVIFNGVPVIMNAIEARTVAGDAGNDLLDGPNISNQWQLTSYNTGTLNSLYSFNGIESLAGGTQDDNFKFSAVPQLSGSITGGTGRNTLDYTSVSTTVAVDLGAGQASGVGSIAGINSVAGNHFATTFTGPNTANTWNINGTRSGDANNGAITFTGVTKLVGGSQNDLFKFTDSALGITAVDGGAGNDTLDHTQLSYAVRVLLQGLSTSVLGQFANIESVTGSGTAKGTIYGTNDTNNWTIDGVNQGSVNGIRFSNFDVPSGGQGTDRFTFLPGGSVTGLIDAGGGLNVLDYGSYGPTGVNVNLTNRTATATGGVANFRFVLGSPQNDTLVGDYNNVVFIGNAGDDSLTGGLVRDMLIGGSGNDVLHGSDGYDILYGGTTTYYNESTKVLDLASLDRIMQTWMSSLEYSIRVGQLNTGPSPLLADATLFNDFAVDTLYGEAQRDWFLKDPLDNVVDLASDETATGVHAGPVNNPPTLTAIATLTGGSEDSPFAISYASLLAASNAFDADGQPISFRIESLASGTLTKSGSPVAVGTLLSSGESLSWSPSLNANGTLTAFTVKAWDGLAASASPVNVVVNVAAVNDSPTLTTIAPLTGALKNTPFTITYSSLASGSDAVDVDGDSLQFSVDSPTAGSLTKNGVPVVAPTLLGPGESLVWQPPTGVVGNIAAFTARAWDGQAYSASAMVSVQVTTINHAPQLTTVNLLTGASEDTSYTISYAALATAADDFDSDGDPLAFRVESLGTGTLTKNGVAVAAGTLLATGESFNWLPAANANGTISPFAITAWDGLLASSTPVAVNVAVAPVNDAPTLTSVTAFNGATAGIAYPISFAALATAANEADVESDSLTFRIENVTAGVLTKNGAAVVAGTTLVGPGDTLSWTSAANASGPTTAFSIRAWDGQLASATAVPVSITVGAADGPPVATIVGTSDGYQGVRGQTRTLLFQATDPSPSDQAGTFNYTINWGDGAVQSVSGPSSISVDHTYFLESPYRVTVQARDQQGVTGPVSNATTLNIGIFEQQGPSVALAGSSGYDTFIVNQTANRTFSLSYNYAPYGTVTIGTGGEIRLFGQGNWDQVTLNGTTGNDTFDVTTSGVIFNGVPVIMNAIEARTVAGDAGNDLLDGPNISNQWQLTSYNTGTLNSLYSFNGIESLAGGTQDDNFKFSAVPQLSGSITGGTGRNTLDYTSVSTTVAVDLGAGQASGVGSIAGINSVAGNHFATTFTGPNTANTWNINGTRSGDANNGAITFTGVTKLVGGSQNDLFKFTDSALGITAVDGGAGNDTLDHTQLSYAVRVLLQGLSTSVLGQFANIESVTGSGTAKGTIYGTNDTNNWTIDGVNQGSVNGIRFSNFDVPSGGQGTDRFTFLPGGSVTGLIDAGGGLNVLDYGSYGPTGVNVNLTNRTATATGGVANFRFVLGSPQNDTLVGDYNNVVFIGNAGDDSLTGGLVRDMLIGGSGNDVLHGSDGYDILYGGTTTYYNESTKVLDLASLDRIMQTWMSSLEYSIRVGQLNTGPSPLLADATLFNDFAVDTLYGEAQRDWFLKDPLDNVVDLASDETATGVHGG